MLRLGESLALLAPAFGDDVALGLPIVLLSIDVSRVDDPLDDWDPSTEKEFEHDNIIES